LIKYLYFLFNNQYLGAFLILSGQQNLTFLQVFAAFFAEKLLSKHFFSNFNHLHLQANLQMQSNTLKVEEEV